MISVISDVIDGIRDILQLVSLVNIFTVHDADESLKDGVEVRIEHLSAPPSNLVGVDEQVLKGAHNEIRDGLMLVTVLQALVNEGLEVYFV